MEYRRRLILDYSLPFQVEVGTFYIRTVSVTAAAPETGELAKFDMTLLSRFLK